MACQKVCKQGRDDIIVKVNYRMAQPTKWVPAILDYMKKVKSNISTVVLASII